MIKKFRNKNFRNNLWITFILCIVVVAIVTWVQLTGQNKVSSGCSYLDPITIDILAFLAAIFLIIEGFIRMTINFNESLKKQFSRIIRIVFGFCILTLHIMQFFHKLIL